MRSFAAFGLLPALLCLILFGFYANPDFGEHSDPVIWLLILGLSALAAWLGRPGAEPLLARLQAPAGKPAQSLAILAVLACAFYLLIARLVLDAFPNSGDEIAYVMQAQTFARGRLWVDLPAVPKAFQMERFVDVGGHWISQYPPGWALILAPLERLGAPLWIVNPAIGALSLVLFYAVARRHVGPGVAWLAVLALGLSAFYALNAAAFFNHPMTLLCALAFALFAERFLDRGRWTDALLAGIAVGVLGVTRTQNALPFAAAFLLMTLPRADRRAGLLWFGLGGAPLLAGLLAYNAATTGSPMMPPQNASGSEPVGDVGLTSVRLTVNRMMRLHQWTSPILLYGSLAAFVVFARRRALGLTDWIAPITFALFLAYGGDGGNQYGPRYYFEAWPFAILTLAKLAQAFLASDNSRLRQWTASAVIVALACQIAFLPPRLAREHQVVVEREAVYRAVEAARLERAIVMIDGLVSTTRSMMPTDLVRNGLDVGSRDVLYARAVPGLEGDLRRAYPGRRLYVFRKGQLAPVS